MTYRINPAFERFPAEASLVGQILSAFGELEITVCRNAGQALQSFITVMRTLYKLRMTSSRMDVADGLSRPTFAAYDLGADYDSTMIMVRHCLKIRNQFAHCNWADHPTSGLFFADLETSAQNENFEHFFKHIDQPILTEQLEYFRITLEWLEFINHELAVKLGKLSSHVWPRPPAPTQPPLHSPTDQHLPPWLSEDEKARHLARVRASQGGPPTPTPGQQALDKARAEKRSLQQEQIRRSEEGSSKNPPE
jgi:hypothetical protein